MALQEYYVEPTSFASVRPFIKKWHYSPYVNVQEKHSFGLYRPNEWGLPELVGAMVYTRPAGAAAAQKYYPENPSKCLELRRLCCIDDTPKNAESFFVSRTIKWLRKNTDWKCIVSYADPAHGHEGTIYKASNFKYLGLTAGGRSLSVDGKEFHIRTLTMLDRPYGREISERYKNKDPNIKIIEKPPKHIYVYYL